MFLTPVRPFTAKYIWPILYPDGSKLGGNLHPRQNPQAPIPSSLPPANGQTHFNEVVRMRVFETMQRLQEGFSHEGGRRGPTQGAGGRVIIRGRYSITQTTKHARDALLLRCQPLHTHSTLSSLRLAFPRAFSGQPTQPIPIRTTRDTPALRGNETAICSAISPTSSRFR
jgi:hypothetical protein